MHKNLRKTIIAVVASAAFAVVSAPTHALADTQDIPLVPATGPSSLRLGSAFVDPVSSINWSEAVWDATLEDAAEAGISSIIIQQSAIRRSSIGIETLFPSTLPGTTQIRNSANESVDVLGMLLPLVREHGLTVRIGLFRDEGSWFEDLRPASDDLILSQQLAAEIWGQYWNYHDILDGWYLPAEVNVNMIDSPHRPVVATYFAELSLYLHANHNNMSVMTSPYFNANAGQHPDDWTDLWIEILEAAPIDIIALQDGTGDPGAASTRPEIDEDLTTWFGATKQGVTSAGSSAMLWDNVNLYAAAGTAADLGEVALNMQAVATHVTGYTSFGYFTLWAPWAVGNDSLHLQFVDWN